MRWPAFLMRLLGRDEATKEIERRHREADERYRAELAKKLIVATEEVDAKVLATITAVRREAKRTPPPRPRLQPYPSIPEDL